MKKNFAAFGLFALLAIQASAYRVSVDTYVSNAGKTVTVPVVLDNAAGLRNDSRDGRWCRCGAS